jgi:hypothetical protein
MCSPLELQGQNYSSRNYYNFSSGTEENPYMKSQLEFKDSFKVLSATYIFAAMVIKEPERKT